MKALQAIRRLISRFDIRALIAVVLALRIMAIQYPRNALVFDEAYYVPAARDMINGVASNLEHPFLRKLIGALIILAFGDNWMGWRIPIVICSTLALYVFYLLAKNLIGERRALYADLGGTRRRNPP